ncbi:hypothetical protein [Shewanella sp. cp20]|uniref:hypothetical protein n=1 Tax=Shewanella sp. cp20 TaxID=1521167 RepID=UPI00059EE746|nr:hypothetical protein [Shewanella sp. cp20]KIO36318.1 hypothetical protein DB48_12385 [Shewanella sp. cp20]
MKPVGYFLSLLMLFSQSSYALVNSNAKPGSAEFLIYACQEYTELYKKREEPRFGAFLTTSKEESFRAGYCLGAIMHANSTCSYSYAKSVYLAAEAIASVNLDRSYTEASLLEKVVCR